MSHIERWAFFEEIEKRLRLNGQLRERRGGLVQDQDRLPGEVFLGNYQEAGFVALPLRTKRKGGPARISRVISEMVNKTNRVWVPTYAELYGDHESFEVYVHTCELEIFRIIY